MTAQNCLFCRIVDRQVPSHLIYESDLAVGFTDIKPQAPVHALFVPKRHVHDIQETGPADEASLLELIRAAKKAAKDLGVAESGYRLVINCREDGGQTVDHLHMHLLGGRRMTWPPG
jgi:histidine triad (HIT) family protein